MEWRPSKNGNQTTTYKGFRATCFSGRLKDTAYIYLQDSHVGRVSMSANDQGLQDFKEIVDTYYNGILTSYHGNKEYLVTGFPIVKWFPALNALQLFDEHDTPLGFPSVGKKYKRGKAEIEVVSFMTSYSNSRKTMWIDTTYKIYVDGNQYIPKDKTTDAIDPDTQPGIYGYFQSFNQRHDRLAMKVATKEGKEWEVVITSKIPSYAATQKKINDLKPGSLIETTVSNHNNTWGGDKYFNGLSVVNNVDTYLTNDPFKF